MPDGVIPASPYSVLQDSRKPSRYIDGPYIASRPAYQMFAEQARTGASISDIIAADQRSQAKADGRNCVVLGRYGLNPASKETQSVEILTSL